ncbi:MAG TPA: S8 family serine peptidase [Phycisphaerales bacterium]|nr:S8 family serine peptidase [Phycisphaerales bacterium]
MFSTASLFGVLDGGDAPLPSAQWDNGHTLMGLTQMWDDPRFSAFRGGGMRTVVLDTGINLSSPFFGPDADGNGVADRIVYQYDFANSDADATDLMGHGSNVASATASSDPTYGGVAPEADIIALRVFNDAGQGSFLWLERGLQWVVAHAAEYNIASVNMSLGDGRFWSSNVSLYNIGDELASLAAMGVIVTAAAGNGYHDGGSREGLSYPAADPNVVSVGAVYGQSGGGFSYAGGAIATTSPAGALTPFTQRGPTLDILAPGAPIVGAGAGAGLSVMHGTSQAAPQIAGLALLAQEMATTLLGRRLGVDEFRDLLAGTASIVVDGDDENDNVVNTGDSFPLVNALAMAEAIWGMRTVAAEPVANSAPTIDGVTELTGALVNRGAVIDYQTLARAVQTSDADGDTVGFIIEKVCSGTLTVNGRDVEGCGAVVRPGDRIVWTPDADTEGQIEAFRVRAADGVGVSADEALVAISVSQSGDPAYARGMRLITDAPLADGVADVASSAPLPTVRGLHFLQFQAASATTAGGGGATTAGDLFAGVRMRIAA